MRSVTGYLLKRSSSRNSGVHPVPPTVPAGTVVSWKRRFFKLNGCSFTYYSNHQSTQTPNGQLFVFSETIVTQTQLSDQSHCFSISIPFDELILACDSPSELRLWIEAFKQSIAFAHGALRGSLLVRMNEGKEKKKYVVLHGDFITIHKDAESLNAVQGLIQLNENTLMEYNDHSQKITLIDTPPPPQQQQHHHQHHQQTFILHFDESTSSMEYTAWKEALTSTLRLYSKVGLVQNVEATINIIQGIPNQLKQGILRMRMRPQNNGEHSLWTEHLFFLNGESMFVVNYPTTNLLVQSPSIELEQELNASLPHDTASSVQEEARIIREYSITPNCTVCETSLGLHTFQLVTTHQVLHVQASNSVDASGWIDTLREAIVGSYRTSTDPLFLEARRHLDDNEDDGAFYTVTFPYQQPLRVTFEQAGEWAIVKSSEDTDGTGILVGSALSQINGVPYVLKGYADVMEKMQSWKPPLSLTFRHALRKRGYLWIKSCVIGLFSSQKPRWKKRYFQMLEGRLQYTRLPNTWGKIMDSCLLKGAMVSLVENHTTATRPLHCFQFKGSSGGTDDSTMCMTLRCVNRFHLMTWASAIYHAIAAANGGGYILCYERERIAVATATATQGRESICINGGISSGSGSSTGNGTSSAGSDSDSGSGSQKIAGHEHLRRTARIRAQTEETWLNARLGDDSMDMKSILTTAREDGVDVMDLEDEFHALQLHQKDHRDLVARLHSAEERARESGRARDATDACCEELASILQQLQQTKQRQWHDHPRYVNRGVTSEVQRGVVLRGGGVVLREVISGELVMLELQMEQRRLEDVRTRLRDTMRAATFEHTLELEDAIHQAQREGAWMDVDIHEAMDALRRLDVERRRVDMCKARLIASMASSATGNRPLATTMYLLESAIDQAAAEGLDVTHAQAHVDGLRQKKRWAETVVKQLQQLLHATDTNTTTTNPTNTTTTTTTTTTSIATTSAMTPTTPVTPIATLASIPPPTSTTTTTSSSSMLSTYDEIDLKEMTKELAQAIAAVRLHGGELTNESHVTQGLTRLQSWSDEQTRVDQLTSLLDRVCQRVTYENTRELEDVLAMVVRSSEPLERLEEKRYDRSEENRCEKERYGEERVVVASAVRRWERMQMQGRVARCLRQAVVGTSYAQRGDDTIDDNNNNHSNNNDHVSNNNHNNHKNHNNNHSFNNGNNIGIKSLHRLITLAQTMDVSTGRPEEHIPPLHSPVHNFPHTLS